MVRALKHLLSSLATGRVHVAQAPAPEPGPGRVRVRLARSVVSVGTEGMLVRFGSAGPVGKLLEQPERAKELVGKVRREGVVPAAEAVASKLAQPIPLGYCGAGVVDAVGPGVTGLRVGDRVACNAPHAEFALVPQTLCARIPDGVDFERACFTPLAAIALHATRLAGVELGARVGVVGAGVIGSLAIEIVRAAGASAFAVDTSEGARERALSLGALAALAPEQAEAFAASSGGLDAVLVCVGGDDAPTSLAARMCRAGGVVVLVGDAGLGVGRRAAYDRELSIVVARSYGPGRYTYDYEEGRDLDASHVRWTAGRNFEAVLGLMASGALDPSGLVGGRVALDEAPEVYARLARGEHAPGASVFVYPERADASRTVRVAATALGRVKALGRRSGAPRVALVGAGNYARRVFAPALVGAGAEVVSVASRSGTSAASLARSIGAREATSDLDALFAREDLDGVAILTRHADHAELAEHALRAGKHVFVEKPLALTGGQCDALVAALDASSTTLVCGHNRRYSPHTRAVLAALRAHAAPRVVSCVVRAGALDRNHWSMQAEQGGRVLGEASHWVDLSRALMGSPIVGVSAVRAGARDAMIATFTAEDGSVATLQYLSTHHASLPKELVEVHCAGQSFAIEDWRSSTASGAHIERVSGRDKGHEAMARHWVELLSGRASLEVAHDELFEVARATIEAARQAGV